MVNPTQEQKRVEYPLDSSKHNGSVGIVTLVQLRHILLLLSIRDRRDSNSKSQSSFAQVALS